GHQHVPYGDPPGPGLWPALQEPGPLAAPDGLLASRNGRALGALPRTEPRRPGCRGDALAGRRHPRPGPVAGHGPPPRAQGAALDEQLLVLLGQADDRNLGEIEFLHYLEGGAELAFATVDDDQVRDLRPRFGGAILSAGFFRPRPLEAAAQHLLVRGEVIRPF